MKSFSTASRRSVVLSLLIFGTALAVHFFAQTPASQAQVLGCGTSLSQSTTLLSAVNCSADTSGITIVANNVSLDCGGFAIRGTNRSGSGIVVSGKTGVTINNCVIENFKYGILALNGAEVTVNDVSLTNNRYGIASADSQVQVGQGTISNNYTGINAIASTIRADQSILRGNEKYGLYTHDLESDVQLNSSQICSNGFRDISVFPGSGGGAGNSCGAALCNWQDTGATGSCSSICPVVTPTPVPSATPPALLVDLRGGSVPKQQTVTVPIRRPTGSGNTARIVMNVVGGDGSAEGTLDFRGRGTLTLFGDQASPNETSTATYTVPAHYLSNGYNDLTFISSTTAGYAISSINVTFFSPTPTPTPSPSGTPVPLIDLRGGSVPKQQTITLTVRKITGSGNTARIVMNVVGGDGSAEGTLDFRGRGTLTLFGDQASPNETSTATYTVPAHYLSNGYNDLTFISSTTAGYAISSINVTFFSPTPTPSGAPPASPATFRNAPVFASALSAILPSFTKAGTSQTITTEDPNVLKTDKINLVSYGVQEDTKADTLRVTVHTSSEKEASLSDVTCSPNEICTCTVDPDERSGNFTCDVKAQESIRYEITVHNDAGEYGLFEAVTGWAGDVTMTRIQYVSPEDAAASTENNANAISAASIIAIAVGLLVLILVIVLLRHFLKRRNPGLAVVVAVLLIPGLYGLSQIRGYLPALFGPLTTITDPVPEVPGGSIMCATPTPTPTQTATPTVPTTPTTTPTSTVTTTPTPTVSSGPTRTPYPPNDSANLCEGLVSDKAIHPIEDRPRPAQFAAFIDPAFGTTIRRITSSIPSGIPPLVKDWGTVPLYNGVQGFNADETKLILYQVGGKYQLLDGRTYQFIKYLPIHPSDVEEVYWSNSDPDVFFYPEGKVLYRYHVSTGEKEVLHTFDFCPNRVYIEGHMSYSVDSRKVGMACTPKDNSRIWVYDIQEDTITDVPVPAGLKARPPIVSMTGKYALIRTTTAFYLRSASIYNLETGENRPSPWFSHGSTGLTADGRDIITWPVYDIGEDGPNVGRPGNVNIYYIDTGEWKELVGKDTWKIYPPGTTHNSALAIQRPGWGSSSMVGIPWGTANGALRQEVLLYNYDNDTVCRVAHHRSWADDSTNLPGSTYWAEPHAFISPSGTRIVFGSTWGDGPTVDTYVVELPSYHGVDIPLPSNHAPVISMHPGQTTYIGNSIQLNALVSDDGLPDNTLSYQWSKASGPGTTTFTSPAALQTSATFSEAGTYLLRLTVSDGTLSSNATIEIHVLDDSQPPTVSIFTPQSNTTVGGAITVGAATGDNVAVTGVQFKVDGQALGAPDTTFPFEATIAGGSIGNGAHILTAIATDEAGNHQTSRPVSITIASNPPPVASPNLCQGLVTDKNPRARQDLSKPELLTPYTDPAFGTSIMRIAEDASPRRSSYQQWSADESYLLMVAGDKTYRLYDGTTYAPLRDLSITPNSKGQYFWHPTDPDIFYYVSKKSLMRYHVSTNQKDTVKTYSSCTAKLEASDMSMSWDGNSIGLACDRKPFVYHIAEDQTQMLTGLDPSSNYRAPNVSASGAVAFIQRYFAGGRKHYLVNLSNNEWTEISNDIGSPYSSVNKSGVTSADQLNVVVYDKNDMIRDNGSLAVLDMISKTVRMVVGVSTGYPYPPPSTRSSAPAAKVPGWVATSTLGLRAEASNTLHNEVFLSNTDTNAVCRLAHNRSSRVVSEVVLSPSGTRVLFSSDWGNTGTTDAYVITLPSYNP